MPRSHPVERVVEREVADRLRRLLRGNRRVLLAVSGGPDSVCLLWAASACASALGLQLEVAWVNHGLRREAAGEGLLVGDLARRRGLVFHARAVEVGHAPGLEARARMLREQALEAVRAERGLEAIATGHTASDQAETLLMRLARGSSLRGAAGVLARKGHFVRPLLGLTRAQVAAYVAHLGLPTASDTMNVDPAFLRVRIRTQALPALEAAAGPGVTGRLARFAEYAADDSQFLDALADAAFARLRIEPGQLDAAGTRALELPLRRRVLVKLLTEAGCEVDATHLEAGLDALERGGRTGLSHGFLLDAAGGRLRLSSLPLGGGEGEGEAAVFPRLLTAPGDTVEVPGWNLGWSVEEPTHAPLRLSLPSGIRGPLLVRSRHAGDRITLRNSHTRALQDVFTDAGIPREQRDFLPIVLDAAGLVLWVPGIVVGISGSGGGWLWASPLRPASDAGETSL
ncbi:MAG: tRNA lysidine(34) synthetase TilS [Myxococcaceae bacterium]|nr:tRNA lysidine(34) synthetase TilS [Myxococcaceae bacterium]